MKRLKLFDKVYVKSQKTMGYIVDIVEDSYTVEKEGNAGPIYWNLPEDELVPAALAYLRGCAAYLRDRV